MSRVFETSRRNEHDIVLKHYSYQVVSVSLWLFTVNDAEMKLWIIHEESKQKTTTATTTTTTKQYTVYILIDFLVKQNDDFLKKNEFDQ